MHFLRTHIPFLLAITVFLALILSSTVVFYLPRLLLLAVSFSIFSIIAVFLNLLSKQTAFVLVFLSAILFFLMLSAPYSSAPEGLFDVVGQINRKNPNTLRISPVFFLLDGEKKGDRVWVKQRGEFYFSRDEEQTYYTGDWLAFKGFNRQYSGINFLSSPKYRQPFSYPYSPSLFERVNRYFQQKAEAFRRFVFNTVGRELGQVSTGLLLGLGMDSKTRESVNASGLSYLFVVSGFHFFLTYFFFSYALSFFRTGRLFNLTLKLLFALTFLFVSSSSPSALRAFLMIALYETFRFFDYHVSAYNVVGISALILLLSDPSIAANAGFQLSFGAVLGILLLNDFLKRLTKRRLSITVLGSLLFIIPITSTQFGSVPLLSIPVGFLLSISVIPLTMIALLLSLFLFLMKLTLLSEFFLLGISPVLKLNSLVVEFLSNNKGTIPITPLTTFILTIICGVVIVLMIAFNLYQSEKKRHEPPGPRI